MSEDKVAHRKPSHRLYVVVGEGSEATWIAVGAAWVNRDDQGYSIELDALPIGGRMAMRVPKEKSARTEQRRI